MVNPQANLLEFHKNMVNKTLPISLLIPVAELDPDGVKLWLQKRQENGPLDGTWEFPGGKIEAGETPALAAKREFLEEVGVEVEVDKIESFKTYTHHYENRSVCLFVHLLYFSPESKYLEVLPSEGWKYLSLNGADQEDWSANIPEANKEILKDLTSYFIKNSNDQNWRRHWQQLSC